MTKEVTANVLPREFKADDTIIRSAVSLAVEKAKRFGTPLVIKNNGRIRDVAPSAIRISKTK